MTTACVQSKYFSGQGTLLIGDKDPTTGQPIGLRAVGNVPEAAIGVETTVFQHKESCTGQRGIDKEIIQEINPSLNFTLESLDKENLALVLFGDASALTGTSVTEELVYAYSDLWSPLDNIKVSTVVVNAAGGITAGNGIGAVWAATTTYALGDFVVKTGGGETRYYEATVAGDSGASEPAEISAESSTYGATVVDGTVTWTDRGLILKVLDTDYQLNPETGNLKFPSTGQTQDVELFLVDYDYANQDQIDAITTGAPPEKWVRFEGLNTADSDKPVVIDLFKVSLQPLAELALIQDEFAGAEVETRVLSDALSTRPSRFFEIRLI